MTPRSCPFFNPSARVALSAFALMVKSSVPFLSFLWRAHRGKVIVPSSTPHKFLGTFWFFLEDPLFILLNLGPLPNPAFKSAHLKTVNSCLFHSRLSQQCAYDKGIPVLRLFSIQVTKASPTSLLRYHDHHALLDLGLTLPRYGSIVLPCFL